MAKELKTYFMEVATYFTHLFIVLTKENSSHTSSSQDHSLLGETKVLVLNINIGWNLHK